MHQKHYHHFVGWAESSQHDETMRQRAAGGQSSLGYQAWKPNVALRPEGPLVVYGQWHFGS